MTLRKGMLWLLTAGFFLVHVVGSLAVFEIEHCHDGDADHRHDWSGVGVSSALPVADAHHGHEHHGHGHGHEHPPTEEAPHDEQDGDDSAPLHHSHGFSLVVETATQGAVTPPGLDPRVAAVERLVFKEEPFPEGPFFGLIKPPQLV